jgi:CRP-like cAMP-binding protein
MHPFLQFKRVRKDDILVQPGDICDNGYLIVEGGLIISHVNPNSDLEKVVNFFLPSFQPYCTVWDSYFTGARTQCKLFAFKDSVVGYVNKSEIENQVARDQEIRNFYLTNLNKLLVFENNLRVKLITSTPEEFYHFLLTKYPMVIKNIPNKYIAEFMGISREWLSKIKSLKDNK